MANGNRTLLGSMLQSPAQPVSTGGFLGTAQPAGDIRNQIQQAVQQSPGLDAFDEASEKERLALESINRLDELGKLREQLDQLDPKDIQMREALTKDITSVMSELQQFEKARARQENLGRKRRGELGEVKPAPAQQIIPDFDVIKQQLVGGRTSGALQRTREAVGTTPEGFEVSSQTVSPEGKVTRTFRRKKPTIGVDFVRSLGKLDGSFEQLLEREVQSQRITDPDTINQLMRLHQFKVTSKQLPKRVRDALAIEQLAPSLGVSPEQAQVFVRRHIFGKEFTGTKREIDVRTEIAEFLDTGEAVAMTDEERELRVRAIARAGGLEITSPMMTEATTGHKQLDFLLGWYLGEDIRPENLIFTELTAPQRGTIEEQVQLQIKQQANKSARRRPK